MSADDDRLLEEYLESDSELSRHYRRANGGEQPPEWLDGRIKAMARREIGASSYRARGWRLAWTAPLAAAAVLVLAVGVALHVAREDPMKTSMPPDTGVLAKRAPSAENGPRDRADTEEPQTFAYELPRSKPAPDTQADSALQAEPRARLRTESSVAASNTPGSLLRTLQAVTPGRTTAQELAALPDWRRPAAESRVENDRYEKWQYSGIDGLEARGVSALLDNGVVQALDVNLAPGTTLERLESVLALTGGQRTSRSSLPPAASAGLDSAALFDAVVYENGSERYDLGPAVVFVELVNGASRAGLIRFYRP